MEFEQSFVPPNVLSKFSNSWQGSRLHNTGETYQRTAFGPEKASSLSISVQEYKEQSPNSMSVLLVLQIYIVRSLVEFGESFCPLNYSGPQEANLPSDLRHKG